VSPRRGGGDVYYLPPDDVPPLERALTYPYDPPHHDFVLERGVARRVDRLTESDRATREPVLALGSNRAPAQLARKFHDLADAVVPVERARLAGHDVVYAAHISRYAAIAATLATSPGTTVEVSITWLAPGLIGRMHATEGRGAAYDYARLDGVELVTSGGRRFDSIHLYLCRAGALLLDGAPRAVATIAAADRRFAALDQYGVQAAVVRRLGFDGTVEEFVRANRREVTRARHERRLAALGQPLATAAVIEP
jgi:hypothetical protein